MLVSSGVHMRKTTARVRVYLSLNLLGSRPHPEVGTSVHPADRAGVQAPGQTQRPADELDVPAELKVACACERVDEGLEHHADMIA